MEIRKVFKWLFIFYSIYLSFSVRFAYALDKFELEYATYLDEGMVMTYDDANYFYGGLGQNVTKYDLMGSTVWSNWYGNGDGQINDMALDRNNNIYIVGSLGVNEAANGFITKIDSSGNELWSRNLGGSNLDWFTDIVIDNFDDIYVSGVTESPDFVLQNSYDSSYGGVRDGLLFSFNSDGQLNWSTYFGGENFDSIQGLSLGNNGELFISGQSGTANLPGAVNNRNQPNDAFVSKISSSDGSAEWTRYLGGNSVDSARTDPVVDSEGNIYILGHTYSTDFPTVDPAFSSLSSSRNAFISKLSPDGTELKWSTYFGGTSNNSVTSAVLTEAGYLALAGYSQNGIPITSGPSFQGSAGDLDGYVAIFDSAGNFEEARYLGGDNITYTGKLIAIGNDLYLSGITSSTNIATPNAYDTTKDGTSGQGFLVKINTGETSPSTANVKVLMAEYADGSHTNLGTQLSQYNYSKQKYDAILSRVSAYFYDNSYGALILNASIDDNNESWYKVPKNREEYFASFNYNYIFDAVNEAGLNQPPWADDEILLVVHDHGPNIKDGEIWGTVAYGDINTAVVPEHFSNSGAEDKGIDINLLNNNNYIPIYNTGVYAHELGHILGKTNGRYGRTLPDVYLMGNMDGNSMLPNSINPGTYDIMAAGSFNQYGITPPLMGSFTKERMGWLNYSDIGFGSHIVKSLDSMNFGDDILRLNISQDKYYIMEGRDKQGWDSGISSGGLVIYEVNTNGNDSLEKINNDGYNWDINLKTVLKSQNDYFFDPDTQFYFFLKDIDINGKQFEFEVSPNYVCPIPLQGLILNNPNIAQNIPLSLYYNQLLDIHLPDLDLHLRTLDGKHVGMNYDTGEYEMQIAGVLASGDMIGSSEWIIVPADMSGFEYYVSSEDFEIFKNQHPELLEYIDELFSYQVSAIFNDPNTYKIYKSDLYKSGLIAGDKATWLIDYYVNDYGEYIISAYSTIPEPSSFLLISFGLLGLGRLYKRRVMA